MSQIPILSLQPLSVVGGPSIQHLRFLHALKDSRFACHAVIEADHEMQFEYQEVAHSVVRLPAMPTFPRTKSPWGLARFGFRARSIARLIEEHALRVGARLVHTFGESFLPGAMAARRLKIPSVIHVIGMTIFQPPWVGKLYSRLLRHYADRLVCCQGLITDLFAQYGVPRDVLRVVYNGIDPDDVRWRADATPAPSLASPSVRIGMVGGMDRRKGHLNFVQAAAQVATQRPHAQFYAIGSLDGDAVYLQEVRQAIAEQCLDGRFHLVGKVECALAWMKAMDIYCIPSLSEALSVAGLEAMALSKPVAATRVGGNPEAVIDGTTGLLSKPADSPDLAQAIIRLVDDPALRQRLGEQGRARVEQLFTLSANAQRLADVFLEMVD